jgi:fumarate hydratase class II
MRNRPLIAADVERGRTYALSSPSIATSLKPFIGYNGAAKVGIVR